MPATLDDLPPYTEGKHRALRVVVESPRGSRVKYEYSAATGAFLLKRPLPAGLAYPFDWGFVPGTKASDGDPVDMMLIGDHVSYPGVVIEARTLAILRVMERHSHEKQAQDNPRIIAVPVWVSAELGQAMLDPLRDDVRDFLMQVGADAGKEILDAQWGPAREGDDYIRSHRRRNK